jgi:sugar lactone lactonase YvrE
VAVDGLGDFYIVDASNHRILRVDATGVITTVAGTGPGFSGDGGAATNALLNDPHGVELDGLGNIFIADTANNRIRRVDTAGVITTIAGNGTGGFSGDGGPATSAQIFGPSEVAVDGLGNLFIADTGNGRIRRIDTAGVITKLYPAGQHRRRHHHRRR